MKIVRLVIGIVSIVLFVLIAMQSCAVGIGNVLGESGESSGSSGLILALCMLIAGIIGICCRRIKSGTIVSGVFYMLGGLFGISNVGSYSDLKIWSILCFIFAGVFIIGAILQEEDRLD